MKTPKVLQSKVENAVSEFVGILHDQEFLEQSIAKNTDDLPEELKDFITERIHNIIYKIRAQAMEEVSEYFKKETGGKE